MTDDRLDLEEWLESAKKACSDEFGLCWTLLEPKVLMKLERQQAEIERLQEEAEVRRLKAHSLYCYRTEVVEDWKRKADALDKMEEYLNGLQSHINSEDQLFELVRFCAAINDRGILEAIEALEEK